MPVVKDKSPPKVLLFTPPLRVCQVPTARLASATVQRLFSMFPTGAAGVALILLRISVAATLLLIILPQGGPAAPMWESAGLGLLGIAICLGLFTPVSSIACCLIETAMMLDAKDLDLIPVISSILVAASLGLLGPGAYSLDARMFGRRLVVSSSDKTMSGN